jgi:2,3-bisphosphoglycerate-independent phosphoglycerate mutase
MSTPEMAAIRRRDRGRLSLRDRQPRTGHGRHAGSIHAAVVTAVETADRALGQIVGRVTELGGVCLVTADHGNAEQLLESDGVSPHTAHTSNPVPLIFTSLEGGLREGGELSDLAPTCLDLLGITEPPEMTGTSLVSARA